MKNFIVLILISVLFIFNIEKGKAQIIVTNPTNTTPALAATYTTLSNAITDLQLITSISGPVTITLLAGNPQTAPAGGYTIRFAANALLATPITIAGNNNIITAFSPQVSGTVTDAIFKIVGADYITIRDFIMQENVANSSMAAMTNDMTEWGIALLNKSASDGAQHNNILNNTISLNRNYSNSFAIYSNTNHYDVEVNTNQPITNATSAPNHGNKIYGNVISNVNMGISFIGSAVADYMDVGNDVGGVAAGTGNTITNWGGLIAASGYIANPQSSYCILMNHQKDENVSNNIITSAVISGIPVALRGILKDYSITTPTGTFTSSIINNTITIKDNFATITSFECINSQGITSALSTATININDNIILNNAYGDATVTAGGMTGINNTSVCGILNMNGNIFRGNVFASPNTPFTGIINTAAVTDVVNINNNKLGDAVGNCLTIPVGSWQQITAISCNDIGLNAALSISGNNFQGFIHAGISSNPYFFIYCEPIQYSATTVNINENTFTNLYLNTNELVMLIARNGGFMLDHAHATMNINNNRIVGSFINSYTGSSSYAGPLLFIYDSGSSGPGNTKNIIGNDFSNTNSGAGAMVGIADYEGSSNFGGPVTTISNNNFQNLVYGGNGIQVIRRFSATDSTYIMNNNISNISGTSYFSGIEINQSRVAGIPMKIHCNNNTISGISTTGTGASEMIGITVSTEVDSLFINNNVVSGFSSSKGATTAGLRMTNGDSTTANVFKNKIYDLTCDHISASATVYGIQLPVGAAGTNNIYNNIIAGLSSVNTNNINGVRGINIESVAANAGFNIYYNTIYLNAPASTGTNFGTSGIFATANTTPTNGMLTLRNNIIVNVSAVHGGGVTAAFRRNASSLENYSSASNNNIFYTGIPSATNVILRYGTTNFQTLAAYKTKVSPADANSYTELPPFLNTTVGANADYLHINASIATQAEIGAVNIAGITDDIDAEIRQGNPGYAGLGTAPDIGADEFDGFFVVPVSIISISANRNPDKTITVKWKGENEINLDKYILERSANGQNFTGIASKDPVANNGGSASYQFNDIYPNTGNNFYRIRSVSLNSDIQYSVVVKVDPLSAPASMMVYPNPVVDRILNIRFIKQAKGIYKLQLTNEPGQSIYKCNIEIADINMTKSIVLNKGIAPGNYQLMITSANGKKIVQQIMIR